MRLRLIRLFAAVLIAQPSGAAIDIVVQTGRIAPIKSETDGIEVLAGLRPGDVLLRAPVTP